MLFTTRAARLARASGFVLLVATGIAHSQSQSQPSRLSAVWANEGGDKVLRHEQRAASGSVSNSVWDGRTVRIFAARNEVVNFALVLESAAGASDVSVSFRRVANAAGQAIQSPATVPRDGLFDYVGRDVEVFVVRYLQIRGLSRLSYDTYDERHVPSKMRRPGIDAGGGAAGGWTDRPGADRYFPEIAVPHELRPTFSIAPGENQTVWVDLYVPKAAAPGAYTGTVSIREQGVETKRIPVALTVRNFALPDAPTAKTMLGYGTYDISERYTGRRWADPGTPEYTQVLPILERHWHMMRRHRITPVGDTTRGVLPLEQDAIDRLKGTTYTAARGYAGPGAGRGDDVYAIGYYGKWSWQDADAATFHRHADAWENWFAAHAPAVQRFLYLADEPNLGDAAQVARINEWLDKLGGNPGPGKNLRTFVTSSTQKVMTHLPRVNYAGNWYAVADTAPFQAAVNALLAKNAANRQFQYNGKRPASGSFAVEDDGTALRMLPWAQWKKGIARWFFWESTYWYDYQTKKQQVNVWENANTYGKDERFDPVLGRTGYNHSNGDGVLFYPGTDCTYPDSSYGVDGPIASLRLKYWRRGIQDADYIALAHRVDAAATRAIVQRMVPKVLWEVGVQESSDPSWLRADVSWPVDPDAWERARRELADIIEGRPKAKAPTLRVSSAAPR